MEPVLILGFILSIFAGVSWTFIGFLTYPMSRIVSFDRTFMGEKATQISSLRILVGLLCIVNAILLVSIQHPYFAYSSALLVSYPLPILLLNFNGPLWRLVKNVWNLLPIPDNLIGRSTENKLESNQKIYDVDTFEFGGYIASEKNSDYIGIGNTKKEAIRDLKENKRQ